jgi:hypothetical protein
MKGAPMLGQRRHGCGKREGRVPLEVSRYLWWRLRGRGRGGREVLA